MNTEIKTLHNISTKQLDANIKHFKLNQFRLQCETFLINLEYLRIMLENIKSVILNLIEYYINKYGYNKAKYINLNTDDLFSETYSSILNLIELELNKPKLEFASTYYIFEHVYKSEQILFYIYDYLEDYSLEAFPTLYEIKLAFGKLTERVYNDYTRRNT